MSYLKRLGLAFAAIAFLMSISAVSGFAQRSYRERGGYQDRDSYWQNYRYRRYYRRSNYRLTPREYRRLARQRARLYRRYNSYYGNNGYISYRERRRLARRYYQYRRNTYQDRRNW